MRNSLTGLTWSYANASDALRGQQYQVDQQTIEVAGEVVLYGNGVEILMMQQNVIIGTIQEALPRWWRVTPVGPQEKYRLRFAQPGLVVPRQGTNNAGLVTRYNQGLTIAAASSLAALLQTGCKTGNSNLGVADGFMIPQPISIGGLSEDGSVVKDATTQGNGDLTWQTSSGLATYWLMRITAPQYSSKNTTGLTLANPSTPMYVGSIYADPNPANSPPLGQRYFEFGDVGAFFKDGGETFSAAFAFLIDPYWGAPLLTYFRWGADEVGNAVVGQPQYSYVEAYNFTAAISKVHPFGGGSLGLVSGMGRATLNGTQGDPVAAISSASATLGL